MVGKGEQRRFTLTSLSFSDHPSSYNARSAFLTSSPFSALCSAVSGVYKQTHPFTDSQIGYQKSICRSLRLNEVVCLKENIVYTPYLFASANKAVCLVLLHRENETAAGRRVLRSQFSLVLSTRSRRPVMTG